MTPMGANFSHLTRCGRAASAIFAVATFAWTMVPAPAAARGPDGIADTAEAVIDAVVNVSTKQTVDMSGGGAMPQLPPGSPFEEFFEDFFKNRRGPGADKNGAPHPRRVNSLGIGFAIPSKIVVDVIAQLREYGETRRGWLGVRIQQVNDEIAESLSISPPRGALIAGVDDKGPAKPAGLEPGDVVVKFDGKDVKEMRDLPRIVAATPVGKDVEVVLIRKGKEVIKTVKLGRLEDGEKQASLTTKKDQPPADKPAVKKALGLEL